MICIIIAAIITILTFTISYISFLALFKISYLLVKVYTNVFVSAIFIIIIVVVIITIIIIVIIIVILLNPSFLLIQFLVFEFIISTIWVHRIFSFVFIIFTILTFTNAFIIIIITTNMILKKIINISLSYWNSFFILLIF